MHTASLRPQLLCCHRFVQHGVGNCESTLMQLWKCFTVSPLRSACLPMHQTTMKTKGRQLQRACKTRWLSSEATVRARSGILAIWPHWSSCWKIKMMQCALFYCDVWKQKFQHGAFLLSTLVPHLTELSKAYQAVSFDVAQVKASVELCINKLSDATAKSELKLIAKSLRVN